MKQNTKETIGSRGTVAGFRPLIGEEQWIFDHYTKRHIAGECRPLLHGENGTTCGMLYPVTRRPLPPPKVETFEAHGHVWYRHMPGDAQPVEDSAEVDCLCKYELDDDYSPGSEEASEWSWLQCSNCYDDIIGYRFPGFPAVHTTLQQQQPIAQPSADTQDITKQRDACWRSLLTMYHGWCDVAPDSVAECIADVAKVLYPTDADRCEAEFQKWWSDPDGVDSDPTAIWHAAWQAAKQQKL